MKIVTIGATGYVGSALLAEALERGHEVTAVVRHPEKLPTHRRLMAARTDVYDVPALSQVLAGHDAVVSAFSPGHADPELYAHHLKGVSAIVEAVKRARAKRLLMVGGAGSLEVAPGVELVDTPEFPAQWRQTALATREALAMLRRESTLEWTFVSPPMQLIPGTRTGKYRLGTDQLLFDGEGQSRISVPDYAVAMLDELEQPRHTNRRFTVAY